MPPCQLWAEVDGRGRIRTCSASLASFLAVPDPASLAGRSIDDLALGVSRRTIVRAAADAASTGIEVGPVDLWLEVEEGRAAVGRFWVAVEGADSFRLAGHDLGLLAPSDRTVALEALLLDRVASGDPFGSVLRSTAQLVEWYLPGSICSIGALEDDGVIRHRYAPSLPHETAEALDTMAPTDGWAAAVRAAPGLVVATDLGELMRTGASPLRASGLHQAWAVRIEHDDAVLGLLVVFLGDDVEPDGPSLNLLRHVADMAGTAIAHDLDDRARVHQSLHDPLTGLPNRRMLIEDIERSLALTRRRHERTAVLMIDLDDFKVANDSLSHGVGDRVLTWVAEVLSGLVRPGEAVGRFGGDAFLLVTVVSDACEAVARAEEVRAELDTSIPVGDVHVRTAASVGAVVAGISDDPDTLLRDADAAMHTAKRNGRNRVELFDQGMRDEMLGRIALESALRSGIARRELEVHYQPIVELERFSVIGVEALVRWRRADHPELLTPGDFVPVAENAGLINEVGLDVLSQATRAAADLRCNGWPHLVVSVNVSPRQLTSDLVDVVADALARAGLVPDGLMLEITETALAREGADAIVRQLDQLGVRLAIDDFGTGYSSLNHLRRFPLADVLKIDASFVADLEGPDPSGRAIVAAAITLGHSLGMRVTSEGVETLGQLQLLREMGCDHAQGFLMSPAVPAAELPATLGQVVSPAGSG